MEKDTGAVLSGLRVDGGASRNDFLMQFQSDIIGGEVNRPQLLETTALGAAGLAGLEAGLWSGLDELRELWSSDRRFSPVMPAAERERRKDEWHRAVGCSMGWAK
jgi:glycerol kinase